MDKTQVYDYLKEKGIPFEAIEHKAVSTIEQAEALDLPHPEAGAKNLFLRDSKRQDYYLLTVRDALTVRIKDFGKNVGAKHLSFASEEALFQIMGLAKGAVTPLGVMNDGARIVKVYFDAFFEGKTISVHPNENTATVFLQCDDLVKLIQEHGNPVSYFSFEDRNTAE